MTCFDSDTFCKLTHKMLKGNFRLSTVGDNRSVQNKKFLNLQFSWKSLPFLWWYVCSDGTQNPLFAQFAMNFFFVLHSQNQQKFRFDVKQFLGGWGGWGYDCSFYVIEFWKIHCTKIRCIFRLKCKVIVFFFFFSRIDCRFSDRPKNSQLIKNLTEKCRIVAVIFFHSHSIGTKEMVFFIVRPSSGLKFQSEASFFVCIHSKNKYIFSK